MLNKDQAEHLAYLSSLPADKRSPCGWYTRTECDKGLGCPGCRHYREKAELPPHHRPEGSASGG